MKTAKDYRESMAANIRAVLSGFAVAVINLNNAGRFASLSITNDYGRIIYEGETWWVHFSDPELEQLEVLEDARRAFEIAFVAIEKARAEA